MLFRVCTEVIVRNPAGAEHLFYGTPAWRRLPVWRRAVIRWWFVVVLLLWVIVFSACAGDARVDDLAPRLDVNVEVLNDNWLEVTVYAVVNAQRLRLGNVGTGNERTFVLPPAIAGHPDLRFLIDPVGSARTYLTETVLVIPGEQSIVIRVANNLSFSTVIVR